MTWESHLKWHCYIRQNATVQTREPSTPPNLNVGYVRTWSRYLKADFSFLSVSFASSLSRDLMPNRFWLKFSTSWTSSFLVLLHDVITYKQKFPFLRWYTIQIHKGSFITIWPLYSSPWWIAIWHEESTGWYPNKIQNLFVGFYIMFCFLVPWFDTVFKEKESPLVVGASFHLSNLFLGV